MQMVRVRKLDQRRSDEVAALLTRSGLPTCGLTAHVASTLIAVDGADIVGCAALELYGDAALLRSVAVAESYRGQGIGHSLFESSPPTPDILSKKGSNNDRSYD